MRDGDPGGTDDDIIGGIGHPVGVPVTLEPPVTVGGIDPGDDGEEGPGFEGLDDGQRRLPREDMPGRPPTPRAHPTPSTIPRARVFHGLSLGPFSISW